MFEKESEEWLERYKFRVFDEGKCNDPNLYAWSALAIKECYIAGAEFGYNKAMDEMQEQGLALQSDMDKTIEQNIALKKELEKANEWHYVKDGKYPKENQLVMVYRVNPLGANIAITNWYDSYKDTKVIAWKEIVLPKEIKEK